MTTTGRTIAGSTILVTGANRGIGQTLVEEALARGAKQIYAGTRKPFIHPDPRVTTVTLDVTNADQIRAAAEKVHGLDILINNGGIARYDSLTDSATLGKHLAVNLFGGFAVTRAFLPELIRSHGAIVNALSLTALAPFPLIPAYSISKATAFNLTQSLRALLSVQGVAVHAVLTGPTDTDMSRDLDVPKASPRSVAQAIFDGIVNGDEDIFPDPMAAALADGWNNGAVKAFERQNAAAVAASVAS